MEKMNASQSSVVKCSPLNRGVIGSQGRDQLLSLGLSEKLASWHSFSRDETYVCNYKDSLFIGFIFIEYLL